MTKIQMTIEKVNAAQIVKPFSTSHYWPNRSNCARARSHTRGLGHAGLFPYAQRRSVMEEASGHWGAYGYRLEDRP